MTRRKKKSLADRIKDQPVLFMAFIKNGVTLLVAFGLKLTAEQVGAILLFINSGGDAFVWTQVEPLIKRQERDVRFLTAVVSQQDVALSNRTEEARTRTERAQGRGPASGGRLKAR